jgi:signal transduction histidine kinase/ActR/RegA family two-component response regulator
MTDRPDIGIEFASGRVAELLDVLERMAAGDTRLRLTISDRHDELDALAHGINVLVGELGWATARIVEAHEERALVAERANNSKNVFLRNVSHEIRTPITAMLGFASLLASSALPPDKRSQLVRRLEANAGAALSLLDDLLDLARLDAQKLVLDPQPVFVIELVQEVFSSLEIDSRGKGLEMRVAAAHEALGALCTDRNRLRQILINLVANAIKFTPAGRVGLELSATPDADGDRWTIDVTDTGIGIAPDRHSSLFEPFEQVNASIPKVYGGNGLGLALSRRLAEQLGGSLTLLHSAPGEGTAFRLIVRPLPAGPDVATMKTHAAPDAAQCSVEGLHILLAEDHKDLHLATRELLEQSGASVESAFDGREAVAKAMSAAFDVVLMDVRMPQMNGLEATQALRSQGYAAPIVALTADPAALWRKEAMEAGCDACLSKPFRFEDVVGSIRASSRAAGLTSA